MKIIVFGDIHGATMNLIKLNRVLESADLAVFVGDGVGSLEVINANARKKLVAVRGNCDFFCSFPTEQIIDVGAKIFVTHGNEYGVKSGLGALVEASKARGASICFFGHNHKSSFDLIDGIAFINPGTLGNARTLVPNQYALVITDGDKVNVEHKCI